MPIDIIGFVCAGVVLIGIQLYAVKKANEQYPDGCPTQKDLL